MIRTCFAVVALLFSSIAPAAVVTGFSFGGPGVSDGFIDVFTGEVVFPPGTPVRVSGDIEILNPSLQPDAGATGVFTLGDADAGDFRLALTVDVPGFRSDFAGGPLGVGSITLDGGTLVGFSISAPYETGGGIDVDFGPGGGVFDVGVLFLGDGPCCGYSGTFQVDSLDLRTAAVPEPARGRC